MKCHVCGSKMLPTQSDLPFKVRETTTVIAKALPVLQCQGCGEYLLEDSAMGRADEVLKRAT